ATGPLLAAIHEHVVADAEVGDGELEVADAEEEAAERRSALAAGLVGEQGGDGLGEVLDREQRRGAVALDERRAGADGRAAGHGGGLCGGERVEQQHRRAMRQDLVERREGHVTPGWAARCWRARTRRG